MAGERCGTCRFVVGITAGENRHGDCHRYPPKPGTMREWPEVHSGDWCGEWQPRRPPAAIGSGRVIAPATSRKLIVEPANARR